MVYALDVESSLDLTFRHDITVPVSCLTSASQHHAGTEESYLIQVVEDHSHTRIHAEYLHGSEESNGANTNAKASVMDVIVMDMAASQKAWRMRCSTDNVTSVCRQAANIMNMSSTPIPVEIEVGIVMVHTMYTGNKKFCIFLYIYHCKAESL